LKRSGLLFIIFIFSFLSSLYAQEDNKITAEFYFGAPYNVPLPLTINQNSYPEINLTAQWSAQPFTVPMYWNWRISYWKDNIAWELEATHNKIFLENRPPEISEFSISHGLNTININYVRMYDDFILRFGAGIILAHPESQIRGKKLNESLGLWDMGYYLTGPTLNFVIGKRFNILDKLFFQLDLKTNASYASVPVVDGDASLYNLSFQLNFGLGYDIISWNSK